MLYSDKLVEIIAEGYKSLAPIYNFLIKAEIKVDKSQQ
jgi:hypothetical protein